MTTQTPDKAKLFGSDGWNLLESDSPRDGGTPQPNVSTSEHLFNPAQFGLRPSAMSTACWKGYNFGVCIDERGLRLEWLLASQDEGVPWPRIGGIAPSELSQFAEASYRNLDLKLPFTGTVRVGREIDETMPAPLYGLPNYLYKYVVDIEFCDGDLVAIRNLTRHYEEYRKANRDRLAEDGDRLRALFE